MRVRDSQHDLIGYQFSLEELTVLKAALENSIVQAYIQTQKTNFVTEHVLTPLLDYQQRGPNVRLNMALNEAYLKGAIDFATELLNGINLPGES